VDQAYWERACRERETESGERLERGLLKGHGTYPRRAKLGRGWGELGEG